MNSVQGVNFLNNKFDFAKKGSEKIKEVEKQEDSNKK